MGYKYHMLHKLFSYYPVLILYDLFHYYAYLI